MLPKKILKTTLALSLTLSAALWAAPAAQEAAYTVQPDKPKQLIKGIGFEIQSDSIGSGNHGLPEEPIAVPHDLTPAERERLAKEMLKGFRYCRLAGGLYWRGLDAGKKFIQPRWPEQLQELKQLLDTAGVEGVSFEYWSPAPFWKGNQAYYAQKGDKPGVNSLRCFGPDFANDPVYQGDAERFLSDFANAVVADIKTLQKAGIKVSLWGLQNEPEVSNSIYSSCRYPNSAAYVKAYTAVARAIRAADPSILLFADTGGGYPKFIAPAMQAPAVATLVDAYAVHIVGSSESTPMAVHKKISENLPKRPWFQNEYEYLTGGATPDRCLNTVQHIMNSFQLAENPTWFWIHCLKPLKNAEASGYALGFWKSLIEKPKQTSAEQFRRWVEGPEFTSLPEELKQMEMISAKVKESSQPSIGYKFIVNQPVTVYLLAEDLGELKLGADWEPTKMTAAWQGGKDRVFKRDFQKGNVEIPAPKGSVGERHAAPHLAFVKPSDPAAFRPQIGINLPIQIRSETIALERKAASIEPGHWIFNPYNWNAVGSFVKRMPWDCVALEMQETQADGKGRLFAFKKPNGKVTVVVSNHSPAQRGVTVSTGLENAAWKGFRYTPEYAGKDCMGLEIGTQKGKAIAPKIPAQAWEFWEEQ